MSGVQECTSCRSRNPLLAPLSLISLCQIVCSKSGRVPTLPRRPCGALLCYDFALRYEAAGCSCAIPPDFVSGPLFRVARRANYCGNPI